MAGTRQDRVAGAAHPCRQCGSRLGRRDYNLLLGIFFISSVMVVAFNLITDLIYTFVDPRIEVGR